MKAGALSERRNRSVKDEHLHELEIGQATELATEIEAFLLRYNESCPMRCSTPGCPLPSTVPTSVDRRLGSPEA